ncbi:hypothetical protein VNO78_20463 [Psophocarpus tetragonolobus]|uniref:Uncharacterized protein n=1 Tax=Psophocarpus tetragonolobus TaxID=3891 RepID=A0AAN9SEL9_PSOTE
MIEHGNKFAVCRQNRTCTTLINDIGVLLEKQGTCNFTSSSSYSHSFARAPLLQHDFPTSFYFPRIPLLGPTPSEKHKNEDLLKQLQPRMTCAHLHCPLQSLRLLCYNLQLNEEKLVLGHIADAKRVVLMVRDDVRITEDDSPKEKLQEKKHRNWEFALGSGGLCFVIAGSI